jgi:hypothetical protein
MNMSLMKRQSVYASASRGEADKLSASTQTQKMLMRFPKLFWIRLRIF